MKNTGFDKALFKSAVTFNVKNMFRRTIDEATPQQIFQAVAYTVKDDIIDQWITTHKEYEKKDVKTLYYLSMEFLMGRALGNNMINLREYKEIAEALDEMGFDLNAIALIFPELLRNIFAPHKNLPPFDYNKHHPPDIGLFLSCFP